MSSLNNLEITAQTNTYMQGWINIIIICFILSVIIQIKVKKSKKIKQKQNNKSNNCNNKYK